MAKNIMIAMMLVVMMIVQQQGQVEANETCCVPCAAPNSITCYYCMLCGCTNTGGMINPCQYCLCTQVAFSDAESNSTVVARSAEDERNRAILEEQYSYARIPDAPAN